MPIDANGRFKQRAKTTAWLEGIGITTIYEVKQIGVIKTCMLLRQAGFPVTLNLAYGLQADIMGLSWNNIPLEIKQQLREEYEAAKTAR